MMVVTSFIAVVCSGIASLKWRTSSTRPNEVQPCEPCITGMQASNPRKASVAPSGWLIFNGLTEQAFLDSRIFAMLVLQAASAVSANWPASSQGAARRTCCQTGLERLRSISCTMSTMPS